MKIGVAVAQNFWIHFNQIYAELQNRHQVSVFHSRTWPYQVMSSRINRFLLNHDLQQFMDENERVFFEWGEDFFVASTHLKKSSKIIARIHSHELWDSAPFADLKNVDHIIFVSHAMERKFLSRFPVMAGRTSVIYNGVSLDKFLYMPHPYQGVIGTLSRIEPHKRIYDLVIALYELRRQGYDLTLNIGGSCTESRYERYNTEVKLLVERLNLGNYVIFPGQVTDTPAWFEKIDIFISNSCAEGLQVALLEGMACGRYCMSHRWDGAEEALPRQNLYLSEGELLEKVKTFHHLSEASKLNEGLLMRNIAVEKFNIDKQKDLICNVIERF